MTISCSDKSLKFFSKEPHPVTNQGCEYHFFGAPGLGEAAGVRAARRTVVPVVRESEGLTMTLSDSVTPLRISTLNAEVAPYLNVTQLHSALGVHDANFYTFAAKYECVIR